MVEGALQVVLLLLSGLALGVTDDVEAGSLQALHDRQGLQQRRTRKHSMCVSLTADTVCVTTVRASAHTGPITKSTQSQQCTMLPGQKAVSSAGVGSWSQRMPADAGELLLQG